MFQHIKSIFKTKKTQKVADTTTAEKQMAKDVAVRIVEEEKQRKTVLPHYSGLEKYELIEKIGEGAFSYVFKARDKEDGKEVAIKIVRKKELDASENGQQHLHPNMKKKTKATERANILKEVQIMRNIKHNNIIQLIQFSESNEYYFLVLELCQGGELFHRIVHLTYFSEDLARHVIVQVAEGVRFLHEECGVVHRDIKPENILFDPIPVKPRNKVENLFNDEEKEDEGVFIEGVGGGGIGTVKIADFGLSKVIWDNSTLTPCGTVGYTAPEIVRDQKYSKSVDMWAIGCVLYTVLCGFPPFYDESIRALTQKVASGEYSFLSPWWDPISDSAKDLITHLLDVNPAKRYTISEFFEHPWVKKSYFAQSNRLKPAPKNPRAQAMQNAAAKAAQEEKLKHQVTPVQTKVKQNEQFTPGMGSIKEILDITYAVQRMGEERINNNTIKSRMNQDDSISSEEEEEDEDSSEEISHPHPDVGIQKEVIAMAEQLVLDGKGIAPAAYTVTSEQRNRSNHLSLNIPSSRRKRNVFELDMNKATLLKNRRTQVPMHG
ncbi:kinase-like domain-containing protein [Pilobolus umbonatus]|nr:kinase-like domain-containing protein [Pilobolus umbonatus]